MAQAPIRKTIERKGSISVPYVHKYPDVRGGICEWCGVIDNLQPSEVQYMLCDHFKNMGELACSYCDASKIPVEVVRKHTLLIYDHPTNPHEVIVACDSFSCNEKHRERFMLNK